MAVNMAKEALATGVMHFDRTTGCKSEKTDMDLQGDVFSSAKRSANTSEYETNCALRKI
jgi:hypothetical protein